MTDDGGRVAGVARAGSDTPPTHDSFQWWNELTERGQ